MSASVLFLGGTGTITGACAAWAAEQGHEVVLLHRGVTTRATPAGVIERVADLRDEGAVRAALNGLSVDAVVDALAFTPEDIVRHTRFLAGVAQQYVFISSASAYEKPPSRLPVTEATPLTNPFSNYARQKAAAEAALPAAARAAGLEHTIVRPSHTYDERAVPFEGGWTVVERMRAGRPVIVHGDGTSLWTITHARDFARWFVPLLGDRRAFGEAFTITGDEAPTWDAIYRTVAQAAGVPDPDLVHIASEAIAAADSGWGEALLGDKAHSMVFDNTKVRALAPDVVASTTFADGAREIVAWHDADASRRVVDPAMDALMDALAERYRGRALVP